MSIGRLQSPVPRRGPRNIGDQIEDSLDALDQILRLSSPPRCVAPGASAVKGDEG